MNQWFQIPWWAGRRARSPPEPWSSSPWPGSPACWRQSTPCPQPCLKITPTKPIPHRSHPTFLALLPTTQSWTPYLMTWTTPQTLNMPNVFMLSAFPFYNIYPSTSSSHFHLLWGTIPNSQGRIWLHTLVCFQTTLFCMCVHSHVSFFNAHCMRASVATGQCPWLCMPLAWTVTRKASPPINICLREWKERKGKKQGRRKGNRNYWK